MKKAVTTFTLIGLLASSSLAGLNTDYGSFRALPLARVMELVRDGRLQPRRIIHLPEEEFQATAQGQLRTADGGLTIICGIFTCLMLGPLLKDIKDDFKHGKPLRLEITGS